MLVAFIGATIANKGKQSVILGYIAAGILVGPYIHFEIGPFVYNGVIEEVGLIDTISQLGLILLIFFVGLEFSIDKIKKVKGPAVILSIIDVGMNLFVGFLLAAALGWPLVDAIFLAAVMAMSCSAVAMKTLMELGRLNSSETEYIMGMIILEEFISMLFLTVVGGLVVPSGGSFSLTSMVVGMVAFFAFFAVLALFVIPKVVSRLAKMKSDEMFVLFMLGIICVSAAFAQLCGVPALIGAFFIGMVFAETKVMDRMEKRIAPLRDAFAAVFFVSFGMLIDPAMFGSLIWVILAAAALVLINEIFVMSAVAYLVGFGRRTSMTIGASFSARGGESVMYATVGSKAAGAVKGAELVPIAGGLTFIMCILCPFFIRMSYPFADYLASKMPRFMAYGGAVMSRTLGKMILPGGYKIFRASNQVLIPLAAYIVTVIGVAATSGELRLIMAAAATGSIVMAWFYLRSSLREVAARTDYRNLGTIPDSHDLIAKYIASAVSVGLFAVLVVAFTFEQYWPSVLVVLAAYAVWFLYLAKMVHDRTCDSSLYARPVQRLPQAPAGKAPETQFRYRVRWKEMEKGPER